MDETPLQSPSPDVPRAKRPYIKRTGKRKMGFRMDTPPFPVRTLWEKASQEERQKAHSTGVLLLEHWLGRLSRKELAERLSLPPLRVWQLSQQALAAMVTGLLKQPKSPPKGTPLPQEFAMDDTASLKKENEKLRQENQALKDLLAVLKDLPGNRLPKSAKLKAPQGEAGKKISPSNPLAAPPRSLAGKPEASQG